MQPSPIQLKDMQYIGIKLWPRSPDDDSEETADQFDFDGVMIQEQIDVKPFDDGNSWTYYGG